MVTFHDENADGHEFTVNVLINPALQSPTIAEFVLMASRQLRRDGVASGSFRFVSLATDARTDGGLPVGFNVTLARVGEARE